MNKQNLPPAGQVFGQIAITMDPAKPLVYELSATLGKQLVAAALTRSHPITDRRAHDFWSRIATSLAARQPNPLAAQIPAAFEWTVFTSPRAVEYFTRFWQAGRQWLPIAQSQQLYRPEVVLRPRLKKRKKSGLYPRTPRSLAEAFHSGLLGKLATVGDRTAQTATSLGLSVDFTAAGSAARLLESFTDNPERVLLPGSALRRPTLAQGFTARGAKDVFELPLYTMVPVTRLPAEYRECELVIVTAGSALRALVSLCEAAKQPIPKLICLGLPTAQVAQELNLPVEAVAPMPTAAGLLQALAPFIPGMAKGNS